MTLPRSGRTAHQLWKSFCVAVVLVGALVGNAYLTTSVGYPGPLQFVGVLLMMMSLVAAIPAYIGLAALTSIGLGWELRGRESFIQANPGLWVYAVVFYTLFIFVCIRATHYVRGRRTYGTDVVAGKLRAAAVGWLPPGFSAGMQAYLEDLLQELPWQSSARTRALAKLRSRDDYLATRDTFRCKWGIDLDEIFR